MNYRRFTVPPGRTVTLPMGLAPGPGQTNQRLHAGAEIDIEVPRATAHTRYLNARLRAGDLIELDASAPPNPNALIAEVLKKPGDGPVRVVTGTPATPKE